jgi:hypothetical protein
LYLEIDLRRQPADVSIHDVDEFRAFKIVIRGDGDPAVALARVGSLGVDQHAFVDIAAIKRLAGDRVQDSTWSSRFQAMVDYARLNEWLREDGLAIRAHWERAPD